MLRLYDLLYMVSRFNQDRVVRGGVPNMTGYASLVLIYPLCSLLVKETLFIDGRPGV